MNVSQDLTKADGSLTKLIKRYPLITFFVMSVLLEWSAEFLMYFFFNQGSESQGYTNVYIAAFSPVLSAMFLMNLLNRGKAEPPRKNRLLIFLVVFVVVGALRWISRIWWEHDLSLNVLPGDIILVSLSAFVASGVLSSRKGTRTLLEPMINWKVSWVWYVFAVLFWPALTLAGNYLALLIGVNVPESPKIPDSPLLLVILVSFMWSLFINGPIQEEAGWRGFAQPRLQSRFSPLVSSIIIGLVWGSFHWAGFFLGYREGGWQSIFIRLGDISLAILFTWLYNRLKGKSLLPLLLLHTSVNATRDFLPRTTLTVYSLLGIVIIIMIIADKMWKQPQDTSIVPDTGVHEASA
ncbi:MAG TPA: type II CAAX endopeptidase family protein [Clostridia bacterium]|nr:type II CAAX endopeptidase family protein [Clostridia bacterium]